MRKKSNSIKFIDEIIFPKELERKTNERMREYKNNFYLKY